MGKGCEELLRYTESHPSIRALKSHCASLQGNGRVEVLIKPANSSFPRGFFFFSSFEFVRH